jgi:hypothetical protein
VNFYRNLTYRFSLNFSSNSILNLDKLLWGKLFLISSSFYTYFIWNFWSQLGLPFDQISLNYFKLIQINVKLYCSSGLGHPFSSRAGPRAPALSSAPADRPAPPVSDTAARHCAAAHSPGASLLALSGRHARARRTSSACATLRPLSGDDRRSGPGPTAPPRRVAPPRPGP